MAGITTIIAVIALFVGLISIWLVMEAVKKLEIRSQKMVEIHIRGVRQAVTELTQVVADQKSGQEDLVNRVRDVVRNRTAADAEVAALRKELDALSATLSAIPHKSGKIGKSAIRSTGK